MSAQDKFDFFCRAVKDFGVQHILVLRDGKELFRKDYIPEERVMQYSVSKSITGTAAGFAMAEGLFQLGDKVIDYFKDELPEKIAPNFEYLTVRHLMTMQCGFEQTYLMGSQRTVMKETDWVDYILTRPMEDRPGEYFLYSNAGPYLLGVMIEKLTGMSLVDYLMPRLFEPLGIERPEWDTDPMGHCFGAGGIHLSPTELSRFGQLYLQKGVWEGKQILPESWVKLVQWTNIDTGRGGAYSMLFWRSRHDSYGAVGRYGQYCTVIPEKNIVLVINSHDTSDENLLEYFWTYLYPSL